MKKVSVIVPVYNVSKYLCRCISSILNQTFTDFELILINDGSTDNSLEILRKYEVQDSRIVVIDKANEGVSATRNLGIESAQGEYIMFCDSDDFVDKRWIETLYNAAIQYPDAWINCEYYKYYSITEKAEVHCLGDVVKNTAFPKSEYYLYYKYQYTHSCWNRIYQRVIVENNHIRFSLSTSVGEDVLFNIEYLKQCNMIYHIACPLYYWNDDNSQSLSRKANPRYYDIIKRLYFPRLSVISDADKQSFIDEYFYRFYCSLKTANEILPKRQRNRYGNYILNDHEFLHSVKNASNIACGWKLRMVLMSRINIIFLAFLRFEEVKHK